MKKLLFYVIVSLSVVCTLDSCKKEKNPAPKPQSSEISVRQPEAYPAEGGEFSIRYSIENPKEGASLEVSTGDKWITGLKANEKEISFRLETNDTGDERTGSIDLSYEGAEPAKITIRQKTPVYQPVDENGTANCYIVSEAGKYHFSAVKGNGSEAVGTVATVEVLWETFGTSATPNKGDLIAEVSYDNAKNAVCFTTAAEFRKGNALIAAKDATDKILWSWHIWMTDKPEDQAYNNGAGTMLDRNLGATSTTPGDAGALGLLYQWGRKDPFMGASDIAEGATTQAASTIGTWPEPVVSDEAKGTIDYAVSNPVTFILENENNHDWYYTGSKETDNTRWKSSKTIYDPCPSGYRVPDGGYNGYDGFWAKAFGENRNFKDEGGFDSANKGFNFGSSGKGNAKLSNSASTCWYPAAGMRLESDGSMQAVGISGFYWASSIYYGAGLCLHVGKTDYIRFGTASYCASALAVRCMKEQ